MTSNLGVAIKFDELGAFEILDKSVLRLIGGCDGAGVNVSCYYNQMDEACAYVNGVCTKRSGYGAVNDTCVTPNGMCAAQALQTDRTCVEVNGSCN